MSVSTNPSRRRFRVLVAECKQEVSTFNPNPSGYGDFNVRVGATLFDHHRGVESEVGGVMAVLEDDPEIELIPVWGASCKTCGGVLAADAWGRLSREFSTALAAAPAADAVIMCLHGAMAAQGEEDPEGWLLAELRRQRGDALPVVTSLDLHGIATDRMFALSDAVVAFHTYPHVDLRSTGQRAAFLMGRILQDGVCPVTARVPVPVLVRGDELITETGAIRRPIERAKAFEVSGGGLSAGLFVGNPFTDVPELQSYAFAVTDGDEAAARNTATELARLLWADHEKMQVPLVSVSDAMAALARQAEGTVALVDAADATSSGASGDSNTLLRAVLASGYTGRVLVPLVDPSAVGAAMAAGIGATLNLHLGGALDPARFEPLPVEVTVRMLSNGRFPSESWGEEWNSGPTAVLQAGQITIVVTSQAVHLFDRSLFLGHGLDPRQFDAVVVKSPHCQHHMYAAWCREMIHVDAPGATSANLPSLGHTRCPRPIFPLDADVPFTPEATIYVRNRSVKSDS
ncbi:M81 family metallopeptidase [Synoicihabitans lomoniglobus]|uniref:M81 family metallopeptidase n=1 Tax=Synoicihabitans lomoniglobus TaxID=2909285 RepID=A0AAF0CMG8_9BACT|nr:M81 family metallopeptidase [Opitutaceae bacterium LMO-M01]WED64098.1 M81 family metallopeptidase [Opitutaceae bacterium LMO-M01]